MQSSMDSMIKGKWTEIKGDIQKAWGQLTNDELEQTKGDVNAIRGLIQQKYGRTQDDYSQKLDSIFGRFKDTKENAVQSVKDDLKKSNDHH